MAWQDALSTHIRIFSVGRGSSAFIRTGVNQGFIFDITSTDFDVANFIKTKLAPKLDTYCNRKIAQAVLSHPHADHIRECGELADGKPLYPTLLTCPHDKDFSDGSPTYERLNWRRIVNQPQDKGVVDEYKKLYEKRWPPLQTIRYSSKRSIPNLGYGVYYIRPPVCESLHQSDDNAYGNSTSIMVYFRHGANSILFPGDMTPEGMNHLLEEKRGSEKRFTIFNKQWADANPTLHEKTGGQPSLKELVANSGLTILVAPHHGLESCYSSELYSVMKGQKPRLVVVSERRRTHEKDGNTCEKYYGESGSSGMTVERDGKEEFINCLGTKQGHHILAVFGSSGGPKVYADKDPEKLLTKL